MIARARKAAADPHEEFRTALVDGLSQPQKAIPCRFLYDARGSALFEEITHLPEYYPTRTEIAILEAHRADLATGVLPGSVLVELGSGSSRKTEILLAAFGERLCAYVPVDISAAALAEAAERLAARFPSLRVRPVLGDFNGPVVLPRGLPPTPRIGFFPGSTIGNLERDAAVTLLASWRKTLAPGGRLLLGVDLRKDDAVLLPAYNDAAGVTAAFNLNLLARANRELGTRFDLAAFRHEATYDRDRGCIEMWLVSRGEQTVALAGNEIRFAAGERILTERSYKYGLEELAGTAARAGWKVRAAWTDPRGLFSVHDLEAELGPDLE